MVQFEASVANIDTESGGTQRKAIIQQVCLPDETEWVESGWNGLASALLVPASSVVLGLIDKSDTDATPHGRDHALRRGGRSMFASLGE